MFPNWLLSMCFLFFTNSPCTEELLLSLPVGFLFNVPDLQTFTHIAILFSIFILINVFLHTCIPLCMCSWIKATALNLLIPSLIQQALLYIEASDGFHVSTCTESALSKLQAESLNSFRELLLWSSSFGIGAFWLPWLCIAISSYDWKVWAISPVVSNSDFFFIF